MARKAKQAVDEVLGSQPKWEQATTHTSGATQTSTSAGVNSTITKPDITSIQAGNYQSAIKVNGITTLTPDTVINLIPKVDFTTYTITDPLSPPTNLAQQTDGERDRCKSIYKQATNAYETHIDAFNVEGKKFNAIGAQAKAIGAGIQASTDIEKTKGNLIDYLSAVEGNKQKYVGLVTNQYKTAHEVEKAPYTKIDLDGQLKQAEQKALLSASKAVDSQNKLAEFKKQLGEAKKS